MSLNRSWTKSETVKLIERFESCPELWNKYLPAYRHTAVRRAAVEALATEFDTTSKEISRKLHNLRCQFHNEVQKLKKINAATGKRLWTWEYFNSLQFLLSNETLLDADNHENSKNECHDVIIEHEIKEEFYSPTSIQSMPQEDNQPRTRCFEDEPPEKRSAFSTSSLIDVDPNQCVADIQHSVEVNIQPDALWEDCKIFGDFVASELRNLRSERNRRKLKRLIQQAILDTSALEESEMV